MIEKKKKGGRYFELWKDYQEQCCQYTDPILMWFSYFFLSIYHIFEKRKRKKN